MMYCFKAFNGNNFRNTFVMFAKETFDYPELEEHPLLCNHLGEILALSYYV